MERECILAVLREHEQELKAAGLLHLRLFGSIARGDNGLDSDVDILFDCDESECGNVVQAYGYQDEMSELLGVAAHLSCVMDMRPAIRVSALSEAVFVF